MIHDRQNLKNYIMKLTFNLNFINQNDIAEKKIEKKTFKKKFNSKKIQMIFLQSIRRKIIKI